MKFYSDFFYKYFNNFMKIFSNFDLFHTENISQKCMDVKIRIQNQNVKLYFCVFAPIVISQIEI